MDGSTTLMRRRIVALICISLSSFTTVSCGKKEYQESCVDLQTEDKKKVQAGESGSGYVFGVDPIVDSLNKDLSPQGVDLNPYRSLATLGNLDGRGVLSGKFADVHPGTCSSGYLAFSEGNQFLYSVEDPRFQEVMAYHYTDEFRERLSALGVLEGQSKLNVIVHCSKMDNAFYSTSAIPSAPQDEKVCFGDSIWQPGRSYSDDAAVIVHEVQHSSTQRTYSISQSMNRFAYDEGGAINEALSDFMALSFLEPWTPNQLDQLNFSRWALGKFGMPWDRSRGASRCPKYDSAWAAGCTGFASGASGFDEDLTHVSFTYPDGIGWPMAAPPEVSPGKDGKSILRQVFELDPTKEESHTASILLTGALYEIYHGIKALRGWSDGGFAFMTRLIHETLRHLPRPVERSEQQSPLTMIGFSKTLLETADLMGASESEKQTIRTGLSNRGLYDFTTVPSGWARVSEVGKKFVVMKDPGAGNRAIEFNGLLRSTPLAVWFNIENTSDLTVGGVLLTVRSLTPGVNLSGPLLNSGFISDQVAQIRYAKINGNAVVERMKSTGMLSNYFGTHPRFYRSPATAIWVEVDKDVSAKKAIFQVSALATNSTSVDAKEELSFEIEIQ